MYKGPTFHLLSHFSPFQDDLKENDDLLLAAGQVVCEWAQKLLEQSFPGLRDLAEHLVGNLYVGSKSVAAFTVIAAMQESGSHTGKSMLIMHAFSLVKIA